MKTFLKISIFLLMLTQICFAQILLQNPTDSLPTPEKNVWPLRFILTPHVPKLSKVSMHPSFYDRKSEWKTIIKEFWGPGESLADKLATFDIYQNYARAYNATFVWNPVNWDSLA